MKWYFEDSKWHLTSNNDGFLWIITVEEDGTFAIDESDEELLPRHWKPFTSLQEAKDFCEKLEVKYLPKPKRKAVRYPVHWLDTHAVTPAIVRNIDAFSSVEDEDEYTPPELYDEPEPRPPF